MSFFLVTGNLNNPPTFTMTSGGICSHVSSREDSSVSARMSMAFSNTSLRLGSSVPDGKHLLLASSLDDTIADECSLLTNGSCN